MSIEIIGAGAWGTALAICLSRSVSEYVDDNNGSVKINKDLKPDSIRLLSRTIAQTQAMQTTRQNHSYLPNCILPNNLSVATVDQAVHDAQSDNSLAVLCLPVAQLTSFVSQYHSWLVRFRTLLIASKGLLPDTLQFPQQIVESILAHHNMGKDLPHIALISGPSFAKELAACQPTAVTVAHSSRAVAQSLAQRLQRDHFRLYPSDDLQGIAVAGALKNMLAVAVGLSDGLHFGENARSALITRGVHELGRFMLSWGGRRETLYSLAGIGDIMLTCLGDQSRNRRAGLALAMGDSLPSIYQRLGTVEGLNSTRAAYQWAQQHGIIAPICHAVVDIMEGRFSGHQVMKQLMTRPVRLYELD